MSDDAESGEPKSGRSALLWVGGAVSLCCLFATPAATGAVGATAAGGATAALGGSVVRIVVSAVAVGALGVALRMRTGSECCDQ